ncbi:MAG: zinc ribbon domain-containing protein [Bryobacterales bacterium]|nr:zinc ribbon domain-containing protein [Bryobacterales bacterium]
MPLYEYRCKQCDRVFEVIQKFSDSPLTVHEGCGGELERLLSAPGLQFKGTGWYVTDYARSGGAKAGKSEAKNGSTESKGEGSGTSKPAAAPAETSKSTAKKD